MRLVSIAATALILAACTPPAANKTVEPAPAPVAATDVPVVLLPPIGDNPRDRLIGCAGVVAAKANIDTAAKEPTGADTPDSLFYWTLRALLDKEAMPPEAQQAAIEALKKTWAGLAPGDLDARLSECRAAFPAQ